MQTPYKIYVWVVKLLYACMEQVSFFFLSVFCIHPSIDPSLSSHLESYRYMYSLDTCFVLACTSIFIAILNRNIYHFKINFKRMLIFLISFEYFSIVSGGKSLKVEWLNNWLATIREYIFSLISLGMEENFSERIITAQF